MKFYLVFFLLTFSVAVSSQEFKKMENPANCKKALQNKQKNLKSLTADFHELVYSTMFKTPQKGTGELSYKAKEKIRWEHFSPKKSTILIDGKTIKYIENGKEIKDPTTKMMVRKVQNLMVKMLSGEFLDGKEFTISYYESAKQYKLKLKPNSGRMSRYIQNVVLIFDKSTLHLQEMSLEESESEKLVYSFTNVHSNTSLNDTIFRTF